MKPLIISFFGFILCYSLFIDDSSKSSPKVDQPNLPIRSEMEIGPQLPDSVIFFANKVTIDLN